MTVTIRPDFTPLLRLLGKILRRFGYSIIPYTTEKCRVYGTHHCWVLDLNNPVGRQVRMGIPYREDFPHMPHLPSKNPGIPDLKEY